MNPSRIERAMDDLEEYLNDCKPSKLSGNKITVNKDEVDELLRELRRVTPEEIQTYKKVIKNQKSIMERAKKDAELVVEDAKARTMELLSQDELVLAARAEAERILAEAEAQATAMINEAVEERDSINTSALYYTNDLLTMTGRNVEETIKDLESKSNMLLGALKKDLEVIANNRNEVQQKINEAKSASVAPDEADSDN